MVYYQSAVKQYGMTLISGILALLLVSGCVAHNSEKVPEGNVVQSVPAIQTVQAEEMSPRVVENIIVDKDDGQVTVWIEGSRALEYTSIKQSFPFAVSVYLPETGLSRGVEPDVSSDYRIGGIKAGYADEAQTTAKVDILLAHNMLYEVLEEGSRLGILLRDPPTEQETSVSQPATTAGVSMVSNLEAEALVIPEGPAKLTHIEFTTDASGRSDIYIETDQPVRYDTRQSGDDELQIVLYNTKIPIHYQRPLLTRYFNSAVERVDPYPYPGRAEDSRIDIKIREQVPFKVVQNRSGLYISFEESSIQPPEFTKAQRTLASNAVQPGHNAPQALASDSSEIKLAKSMPMKAASASAANSGIESHTDPVLGFSNGPYHGEKIKLDFFDTDIKNVFRILRSVSGQNFAIDKDVRGKVTLSLEQAVPWDQVLDLVLKMNGLGKKMEGNVVRIATAATLTKEEKMLQDAIAARKKSIEQRKALEPLVTEYIAINYSDAKSDIEPHLKKLLTPKRGNISVDQRTNMIILTDTQKKIDEANDLIYRLDKVTPQIMIEAKVVEVTKEFRRSLGVSWNLSNATDITSGFVDDFSVAVNNGASIGVSGDFSFFNLFGTSAALNASLEASEEQGEVKIVSSPRIMTLDNKKAMIKQGQEYAYLERDDSGGSSVKFKDIDLLLEVTPHVTPDKRISMTVKLTKNDVASLTSDGVPITNTNEAETELLVNNRDTIVIGGVVKTRLQKDDDGIPFLNGIPVLGYLFSNKTREDNRNELLIFLTPSIIQLEQKRPTSTQHL